jgi:hypothetical protein
MRNIKSRSFLPTIKVNTAARQLVKKCIQDKNYRITEEEFSSLEISIAVPPGRRVRGGFQNEKVES